MPSNLRHASRILTRHPGFFALASLTLGLGIAANLALFSLLDAVYFRPLPLREPDRLVRVESTSPKAFLGLISYVESQEIAESVPAFEDVVVVGGRGVTLHRGGESHVLLVDYVSASFFDTLGIPLSVGRGFDPGEGSTPQVVVNHRLWRERLGAPPDIVGGTLQLNDGIFTVVGVTGEGFVGLDRIVQTDVFIMAEQAPLVVPRLRDELASRTQRWFEIYARLAPGATEDRAKAQLDALARVWEAQDPGQYGEGGLRLVGFQDSHRAAVREGAVFLALPALVLLIACANVANLLLARTEGRRREHAIRLALGASRSAVVGEIFGESLLLTLSGGFLGLLGAAWLIELFPRLVPPAAVTYTIDARLDARALAFGLAIVLVATALITLASVSKSGASAGVVSDLRNERSSPRGFRIQHVLVASEVAVGVVVLAAAGLITRSLYFSANLDPGFDAGKEVATLYLVPGLKGYTNEATHRLLEEARGNLYRIPSVRRVSYGIRLPAQGNEAGWASEFVVPGKEPPSGEDSFRIRYTMVGPDYFEVLGTRLLAGRGIRASDTPEGEGIAVVSQTMAERLFPGEDPLGRVILMGKARFPRRIVGVAEDVKIADLYEEPEMYVYVPYAQDPQGFGLILIETGGAAGAILPAAKAEMARSAPNVPVLMTGSLDLHMRTVLFEERRDAWIAAGTGVLALLLTTVGLYGLVALVTSQRTREIGIRTVLGASRREIIGLVVGRGLALALAGSVAGVLVGLAASRLLASRLHGIDIHDPWSFGIGAGLGIAVGLLASLVPALRASRLDPAISMRSE
jgi:predicted permease